MRVSGSEVSGMGKEYKGGQMVLFMKDSGKIIELMVKENLHILMATSMKVPGLMIRQTATEPIIM